jgi:transposase
VTGYSRGWIYELVWGYNLQGAETLGDGRHNNPGAAPLMDDIQQANLLEVLQGPSPDGGLWNGRKVADYLSEVLGRPISRQQGWEYLRQMGWRQRVPRPQHQESDPEAQHEWKKNSTTRLRRSKTSIPTPQLKSGAKMNIALASTRFPDESGLNRATLPSQR